MTRTKCTCIEIKKCTTKLQRPVMETRDVSFQAFHLHSKTVTRFLSTNLVPYDNKNRFDLILITPWPGLIPADISPAKSPFYLCDSESRDLATFMVK